MSWVIVLIIGLVISVPFLFKIEKYENVKIVKKDMERHGISCMYFLIIDKDGNQLRLPTTSKVYSQLVEGSTVTLYYNTGDEAVTRYDFLTN